MRSLPATARSPTRSPVQARAQANASRQRFVELAPIRSSGRVFGATTDPAPIEIVLDHGATIVRLGREFDAAALRDVIAILRESAAC